MKKRRTILVVVSVFALEGAMADWRFSRPLPMFDSDIGVSVAHATLWPSLALALVVYGINMLADKLREILDPGFCSMPTIAQSLQGCNQI